MSGLAGAVGLLHEAWTSSARSIPNGDTCSPSNTSISLFRQSTPHCAGRSPRPIGQRVRKRIDQRTVVSVPLGLSLDCVAQSHNGKVLRTPSVRGVGVRWAVPESEGFHLARARLPDWNELGRLGDAESRSQVREFVPIQQLRDFVGGSETRARNPMG